MSWIDYPCCITLIFNTVNWGMEPNKRWGKTRPLVKSGIVCNWEKVLKNDYTHTQSYTHTYHIPLNKVWFRVMECLEVLLKYMKDFCFHHWGKWSRSMQKKKYHYYSCLLEVFDMLQWTITYHMCRNLDGISLITCISKKFEHLKI